MCLRWLLCCSSVVAKHHCCLYFRPNGCTKRIDQTGNTSQSRFVCMCDDFDRLIPTRCRFNRKLTQPNRYQIQINVDQDGSVESSRKLNRQRGRHTRPGMRMENKMGGCESFVMRKISHSVLWHRTNANVASTTRRKNKQD